MKSELKCSVQEETKLKQKKNAQSEIWGFFHIFCLSVYFNLLCKNRLKTRLIQSYIYIPIYLYKPIFTFIFNLSSSKIYGSNLKIGFFLCVFLLSFSFINLIHIRRKSLSKKKITRRLFLIPKYPYRFTQTYIVVL